MQIYDLHTHSVFSDGRSTIEYLVEQSKKKGYGLGVSDHIYCGHMDNDEQIEKYLDELNSFDVLKGVEANIGDNFYLSDAIAYKLDYLIASVHFIEDREGRRIFLSKYFGHRAKHIDTFEPNYDIKESEYFLEKILKKIEETFAKQRVDILGHGTVNPFYESLNDTKLQRDFELEMLKLCKKHNVALEISGLWKEPCERVVSTAKEMGLKFSFGSDCHLLHEVCDLDYVLNIIDKVELLEEDFFLPSKIRLK